MADDKSINQMQIEFLEKELKKLTDSKAAREEILKIELLLVDARRKNSDSLQKQVDLLTQEKKYLTDVLGLAENNKQVAEVQIQLKEKEFELSRKQMKEEREAILLNQQLTAEERKRRLKDLENKDKEIEKEEKINELLRSRLDATKELSKNANKDLNDLGLGLNKLSDSTFGSMLANLAFIGSSFKNIDISLNGLTNGVKSLGQRFVNLGNKIQEAFSGNIREIGSRFAGMIEGLAPVTDKLLGRLAADMNKAFIQNIKDLMELGPSFVEKTGQSISVFQKNVDEGFGFGSAKLSEFGVSLKELSESFVTLNETSSYFIQASQETRDIYQETVLISKKLGISYDSTTKSLDNMTRGFLISGKQASANFNLIQREAMGAGISVGKMGKDFESVFPRLVAQGKQAVSIFIDLAKTANKLGLETSTLLSISEGYDTFEGAAEKAGALNAVLGGDYLNSLEMMNATESERIMIMKRSFDASGMQFNTLDKYSKKAVAASLGISDLNEAERLLSSSTSELSVELMKSAVSEEERTKRAEEATKISEKYNAAIQSLIIVASPLVELFSYVATALAKLNKNMNGTLSYFALALLSIPLLIKSIRGIRGAMNEVSAAGGIRNTITNMLNPVAPSTPPVPTPPTGPTPRAGGGVIGFFRSMRRVFSSYAEGSSKILKGALTMGASMALLAIPLIAIGAALAYFGMDMKPLIELGAAMVLFAGSMFILSKISSGISFLAIASLSGGLALLAIGVFAIGTALQTFISLDFGTVLLGITTIGLLTAAVFGLGSLMGTGVGAVLFGSGLVAISLLGLSFHVLGTGLKSVGEGIGALGAFLSLDFNKLKEIDTVGLSALSGVVSAFKDLEDVDASVVYNVSTVFQNVSNLKDINKEQQEAVAGILKAATDFAVTVNNKSDDRLINVLSQMTDAVLRIATARPAQQTAQNTSTTNTLSQRNTMLGSA